MVPASDNPGENGEINWELNFGELEHDAEFVSKCEELMKHLKDVQEVLDVVLPYKKEDIYSKLPPEQQIELDIFLIYIRNSLFWIYLRVNGENMTYHPLKQELQRVKVLMQRLKQLKESEMRPQVNVEAARRFIRNGLFDINESANTPPNKKIKFEDNDES